MKKYSLLASTILLTFLFFKLLSNYSARFESVQSSYSSDPKSAINLEKGILWEDLSGVLHNQNYLINKADADFVSKFISQRLDDGLVLSSLYDLNKRNWQIPVALIDSIGTKYYKDKVINSQKDIGIDEEFCAVDTAKLSDTATLDPKQSGVINVSIKEPIENSGGLSKKMKPCANVIVRLSEQCIVDTLDNYTSARNTITYLKTNNSGKVSFKGLNPNLSYSVLPIKDGYEYGSSKGTIGGDLAQYENHTLNCSFSQQEHRIRIFGALTLKQIKEDQTITIRSPQQFKNILVKYLVMFFAAWWALWLYCRARKKSLDDTILSILMTLTGLCLLTMFSLNDPLTDKLLGVEMAHGIIIGVFLIAIFLNINFKKFYQNQSSVDFDLPLECVKWIFKPFRIKVRFLTNALSNRSTNAILKCLALLGIVVCLPMLVFDLVRITSLNKVVSKSLDRLPKGFGYLLTALMLTALLFTPLGVAIGGMKVNLNIGILFQPSEIAKYLIIFFIAAYFAVNANKIVKYSEKGNTKLFGAKLKMLMSIFIGLGMLMGLYLVLGDMGPALVIAFTFVILYSIIKSKINLEGMTSENQLKNIFICDIAMLVYGVLSFAIFLFVGYYLGNMEIFCIAWFVVWIIFGLTKQKIHESPIFFNFIVVAFIFGGTVLGNIGLESAAERLDSRNEMCTNTWGTLPLNGNIANAGENTQVAEGLWGLASGGLTGQGLGNGTPHFIPAFHTDMILESIGEQMGFIGVFFIILLLAVLLRRIIVLGYKTAHPFTFYLCMGIAIVTAIQFIVISLGSTGVIPLTGVTVPFFSYGKVSMIFNLAACGLILSIASHSSSKSATSAESSNNLTKQNIGKYNYSVSLLSWVYCIVALFICCVFFYYQFIARDKTLIRPVYVNNNSGIPIVEYNPRIDQLTQKMYSGDIYDRNGVLLATSNKSKLSEENNKKVYSDLGLECDTLKRLKRYYPFGEHLAFVVGDRNSNLFVFNGSQSSGYIAETRHLSELRGYNTRINEDGKELPIVTLSSDSRQIDKWHSANFQHKKTEKLLNYSALIPYLKAGPHSDKVKRLNERKSGDIEPKDIYLTIDAKLQTSIQQRMADWISENYNKSNFVNRIRASVVIIDAENGDLLASANYPLPDSERIDTEIINNILPSYRDYPIPRGWKSYTDMDLGLVYPTAPGSTAKVMSAFAGLQKCGKDVADPNNNNYTYQVYSSQLVGAEPTGNINMFRAIWESSNCYFINLVNEHELYSNLLNIYRTLGAQLGGHKPYGLFYPDSIELNKFNNIISKYRVDDAIEKYRNYIEDKSLMPMQDPIWQWTWGQGDLSATPLTMARVASILANDGKMTPTRFLLDETIKDGVQVITSSEAEALGNAMIYEAKEHTTCKIRSTNNIIGGKTGTANRHVNNKKGHKVIHSNDAWYICYIKPSNKEQNPLAVAVRIERGQSSTNAKKLVKSIVLDELVKRQYISYDNN